MNHLPVRAAQKYKDRMFRSIFSDKNDLLELYNALRGSSYDDPDGLEINTLDNAIYMSMKNDLSFIVDDELNLYEHQSTFNPNMPLRGFLYLADVIRSHLDRDGRRIYGSARVSIPTPHYVVFYNGEKDQPDRQIQKLSDAFAAQRVGEPACLEMTAILLNINLGHNKELMERCKVLSDYAHFVALVRQLKDEGYELTTAITRAIDECIALGILAKFLQKNRAEVMDMLLYEYNEEEHIASEKEISFAEGLAEGRLEGGIQALILDNLEEHICEARIIEKLMRRFSLTLEEAKVYVEKYSVP